jgi:hypothetical protein
MSLILTVLAKHLTNALALKATSKHRVKLLAPSRDLDNLLPMLSKIVRSHKHTASRLLVRQSSIEGEDRREHEHTMHFLMASLTLSTLASLKPLIFSKFFLVVW